MGKGKIMKSPLKLLPIEVGILVDYHTQEANYARDCKSEQIRIANTKPLYKFGDKQSKDDWLNSAKKFENKRKNHRERARLLGRCMGEKA